MPMWLNLVEKNKGGGSGDVLRFLTIARVVSDGGNIEIDGGNDWIMSLGLG